MLNWFKSLATPESEDLTQEEKLERAALLLGVAPSFLRQRLSNQPISKRQAAKLLGLSDSRVGWAKQMMHTTREKWCMDKLGIDERELQFLQQVRDSGFDLAQELKGQDQFKDFLISVTKDYEEEKDWESKRFTEFYARIKALCSVEVDQVTPTSIVENSKDIIVNAYKAAYTALRNQS